MVSTRQMSTSGNCNIGQNANANSNTGSNYIFINCSTIPSVPTRGSIQTSSDLVTTSTSLSNRTTQLTTQAFKECDNNERDNIALADTSDVQNNAPMNLLDLPVELLTKIISYENYKRIGQLRLVSQKFNDVSMHLLNSTFSKLTTQTFNRFQSIKANMPRRESARRNHPLSCEADIIETCYMRLSLLQMTFGKHIERAHCCFFPGAILDEIYTILNYIKNTPRLERPYRVTDELFDLSTMAMEYFRDKIEPTLPNIAYFNKDFYKPNTKRPALVIAADLSDNSSDLPSPPQSNMVLRKGIRKIKEGMKIYNNQLSVLRNELRTCKRKSSEHSKQITEQQKLIAEQQKQTLEYANRLDENDKKNEEMARKFSTLLQELNKCKTELQYWRSKSPALPMCSLCGQKISPIVSPEDYQALINQGVKPQDIVLNTSDEIEPDGENGVNKNNSTDSINFIFPDKVATTKLLAISTSTCTKSIKKQHTIIPNTNTLVQYNGNNRSVLVENVANIEFLSNMNSKNEEIKEGFDNVHSKVDSNIIKANIINYDEANCLMKQIPSKPENIEENCMKIPSIANDSKIIIEKASSIKCSDSISNCFTQKNSVAKVEDLGYSTKLFYGSNMHKGVIVSPSMIASNNKSYKHSYNDVINVATETRTVSICKNNTDSADIATNKNNDNGLEDVSALNAIVSHETKKARRVQKASRCINSGSKRSK